MKQKPNIKYVESFIRTELERRARPLVKAANDEGWLKDCGQHVRYQLREAIDRIVAEANAKIAGEAARLGFRPNERDTVVSQDYWANHFHSPEYWAAEDRAAHVRERVQDETQRLALRVAMGMTAEELEREIAEVDLVG